MIVKNGQVYHLYKGFYKPAQLYLGDKKVAGYNVQTFIGNPLTLTGTYDDCFSQLQTTGASNQLVTHQGKNLFNRSKETASQYIGYDSGTLVTSAVSSTSDYIPAEANKQYTVNFTNDANGRGICFFNSSKSYISGVYYAPPRTFTTPANTAFIRFSYFINATDVQLEAGSAATAYTPFVPNSPSPDYPAQISGATKITVGNGVTAHDYYLPQPLYSLPDGTADEIEAVSGQEAQRIGKAILNGSTGTWLVYPSSESALSICFYASGLFSNRKIPSSSNTSICDKFLYSSNIIYSTSDVDEGYYPYPTIADRHAIRILKSRLVGWLDTWTDAQKVAAFKSWLSANPVTVLYELATPQTISGTPILVPTYPRQTTVSADGGTITASAKIVT